MPHDPKRICTGPMTRMKPRWFIMPWVLHYWGLTLAWLHWSDKEVCWNSQDRGLYDDFHDWRDSEIGEPLSFYTHTCKRCGKEFCI